MRWEYRQCFWELMNSSQTKQIVVFVFSFTRFDRLSMIATLARVMKIQVCFDQDYIARYVQSIRFENVAHCVEWRYWIINLWRVLISSHFNFNNVSHLQQEINKTSQRSKTNEFIFDQSVIVKFTFAKVTIFAYLFNTIVVVHFIILIEKWCSIESHEIERTIMKIWKENESSLSIQRFDSSKYETRNRVIRSWKNINSIELSFEDVCKKMTNYWDRKIQ